MYYSWKMMKRFDNPASVLYRNEFLQLKGWVARIRQRKVVAWRALSMAAKLFVLKEFCVRGSVFAGIDEEAYVRDGVSLGVDTGNGVLALNRKGQWVLLPRSADPKANNFSTTLWRVEEVKKGKYVLSIEQLEDVLKPYRMVNGHEQTIGEVPEVKTGT